MSDISALRLCIAGFFIAAGFFFMFSSAYGILKLPDFMSRLHASGVGKTVGIDLTCIGLIIIQGPDLVSAKIVVIIIVVMITNPIGTHLIGKSALRGGKIKPAVNKERKQQE